MDKYYYGEHEPDPDIRFKQAFKANREHLVSTIQPNVAYPDQTFKVLIPKLSKAAVIIRDTLMLSFNLELTKSKDKNQGVVA